jgi:hypothetical protein
MHDAQQTKLLELSAALALRNVQFKLLAGVRAPNIKLLDQSWVFFVNNRGGVNACPASGKLLQFAENTNVQSILQRCRVAAVREIHQCEYCGERLQRMLTMDGAAWCCPNCQS